MNQGVVVNILYECKDKFFVQSSNTKQNFSQGWSYKRRVSRGFEKPINVKVAILY